MNADICLYYLKRLELGFWNWKLKMEGASGRRIREGKV